MRTTLTSSASHRRRSLCQGLLLLLVYSWGLSVSSTAERRETPKRGGTLRIGTADSIFTLDPVYAPATLYQAIQVLMFRGLFDYDDQNRLICDQAESWSLSEDKSTYTFKLKAGSRYPCGREADARDYIFALERVLNPKAASSGADYYLEIKGAKEFHSGKADHISGLRSPDARTLVIELEQPSYVFAFKLALPSCFPVPRELAADVKTFREHLGGTGPYCLARHTKGALWVLERNPCYEGPLGFPERIEIVEGTRVAGPMMLERDQLDWILPLPVDYIRMKRNPAQRKYLRVLPSPAINYLFLNTEMPPLDDPRVREAICLTIDRAKVARVKQPSTPATGIVPPVCGWTNPELAAVELDLDKARALLRDAGYPNGFEAELWYAGYWLMDAEVIQDQLRAVGIRATLKTATVASLLAKFGSRRQVMMGVWGWVWDYPDPVSFFDPTFNGAKATDGDSLNFAFYNKPEVNRLIEQTDKLFDVEQRRANVRRIEAIVTRDTPWVPLYWEERLMMCSPRLRGIHAHPAWVLHFERVWLED